MAITAVAGQFVATSGTSATAIAGTLPNPPTPGNLLVAMVDCAGAVTPTATGAWTKLTQIQSTDTGALFWKIVPASDPAAQTLTSAGTGSSWGVVIQEFTGATASPLLVQNNQASTTTSKASPSVSPTASIEALIVGGAFTDGSRTWSSSAFTGSNVGSVTNVGTGSRGTAAAGESCTLWYAAISSTTGSYTATVTCSAADGGGAAIAVFLAAPARTVAGSQPSGSGSLTRIHGKSRALAGSQPTTRPWIYSESSVPYADVDATYTGLSPSTLSYELNAEEEITRDVAGIQPPATGALTRILHALRSLAGSPPAATGTLARLKQALRSLSGSQPAATGILARKLQAPRLLAGSQPAATGTLTRSTTNLRSLAGVQPFATGNLTSSFSAPRSIAGAQPASTGTVTRVKAALRTVVGTQPSATGALARSVSVTRSLTGSQPSATGILTRVVAVARSLFGSQPYPTGALSRSVQLTAPPLTGHQPAPSGSLTALRTWRVYIVPGHEQGTSPHVYTSGRYAPVSYEWEYDEDASSTQNPGYQLVPYANDDTTYSDPDVTYQGRTIPAEAPQEGHVSYQEKQTGLPSVLYVAKR